jgi:hypothetical protein
MYMLLNVYVCVHVYVCVLVQAFHMCILHTMQTQMIDACSHVCKCAQGVCSPTMCAYACICHIAFILYMNILSRALSLFLFLTVSFSHTLSLFVSLLIVYPCRACFHMGCLHNQQGQVQRECGCACVERECARERAREMHMRDSRPS